MSLVLIGVLLIKLFASTSGYHPVVNQLKSYVESNKTFALQLNATFIEAGFGPNASSAVTYTTMYNFFDNSIRNIPSPYNWSYYSSTVTKFSATKTGSDILSYESTKLWFTSYFHARKHFADSNQSINIIPLWINWNQINMSQYIIPSSGFESFNDFFSRNIKSGARPIDSINNNKIIVAPNDGVILNITILNLNNLSMETQFNIKGINYNISEMLGFNSYYVNKFVQGSVIQIYLNSNNYHRYHASISGIIDSIQQIGGLEGIYYKNNTGGCIDNANPNTCVWYANMNRRGIAYIRDVNSSKTVAHVFVGLGIVNSVNFDDDLVGGFVTKGDNIGYFKYGGSTSLLLFEKGYIKQFTVKNNQTVKMGQKIAIAV